MMHLSSMTHGLMAMVAAASSNPKIRRQVSPDAPVDPGIPSDCTWYDTYVNDSQDFWECVRWAEDWAIGLKELFEYNPSIKDDCSGIQVGHAYCVEVNFGAPREDEKPKVTSTEDTEPGPEPTEESKPIATQEGLIETCDSLYKAKKGDTCSKIIAQYKTFDFNDFFQWNPAVEKDCSGIWVDTWYCVGVATTPTSRPIKTAETTTLRNWSETLYQVIFGRDG